LGGDQRCSLERAWKRDIASNKEITINDFKKRWCQQEGKKVFLILPRRRILPIT
jgi:hypothetical protein